MKDHYDYILKGTENRVLESLPFQIMDKKDRNYGAFLDKSGIIQAKHTIYRACSMIALYCCSDSSFYHSDKLFDRILPAIEYVERVQHENGLFDYVTCNFYSAPDTAFILKKMMNFLLYLRDIERNDKEEIIYIKFNNITKNGAHGIMEGGFHTPNHRWVIASILMMCSCLYEDDSMKEVANWYLAEGIDCNEDGEFAEKSAGNYNRVNNDAMILLSEATGDDTYDKCAVRNLKMMLQYWEMDGSVFSANSTRFDKDLVTYPKYYYTEYLLMAEKYHIPEFYQMVNTIIDINREKGLIEPDILIFFMRHPEWRKIDNEERFAYPDYRVFYKESGIVRARSGNYTYTIMNGKSNFLYFHVGTMKLEMKVAGSFCEHRAFKAETIEQEDGGFHLHQTMRGWYYLPWDERNMPETNDWWKMDNAARNKKMGPDLSIDVYVKELVDKTGLEVRVVTKGVDGDPFRVELAVTGADFMENDYMASYLDGSEAITVKGGEMRLSNSKDIITVGPGFGNHHFMEGKEDSEGKTKGATTLYFTDYTGFDHTIFIKNDKKCNVF